MADSFQIRRATPADAATIARHRARMFQDMGKVSPETFELVRAKSQGRLEEAIQRGEYLGWLASEAREPDVVVGGAGLFPHFILPRPLSLTAVSDGRQATIMNVFTEPAWRRRGVAALLLREIIEWSRRENIGPLLLHASEQGRSLYERLGFVENNEMRFAGGSD